MAPETERPNILFFFPDQYRHDWLGSTPEIPVRTPNVDRLAEWGTRFTNAVCPSPVCAPSRGCLATGIEYPNNPVQGNADDLPTSATTYFQQLRDEGGYHMAGCGKFDLHKGSFSWGVDGKDRLDEWGFSDGVDNAGKIDGILSLAWDDHPTRIDQEGIWEHACEVGLSGDAEPAEPYTAFLQRRGRLTDHVRDYKRRRASDRRATFPTTLPDDAYIDNWIARQGLSLLDDAPEGKPWHLVVNFAGPHSPFDITEGMHDWYRNPDVAFPEPVDREEGTDPDTHQSVRRNYAAMIENIDRWIGEYLDVLERRGELENTLVVFSSDHGEMLGDHGHWGKSRPYQPSAGVPMVIAGPGVQAGETSDDPVSVLDLHDTFLDYADVSPAEPTDSESLRPVLRDPEAEHRKYVYSALGDWELVFDGRYKLVENWTPAGGDSGGSGRTDYTLFDLESDPDETTNLVSDRPDVVEDLQGKLDEV